MSSESRAGPGPSSLAYYVKILDKKLPRSALVEAKRSGSAVFSSPGSGAVCSPAHAPTRTPQALPSPAPRRTSGHRRERHRVPTPANGCHHQGTHQ